MTRFAYSFLAVLLLASNAAGHELDPRPTDSPDVDPQSDYSRELAQIDRHLAEADESSRVFWLYTKASLTTDPQHWRELWNLVGGDDALPHQGELLLYRATAALELHRPDDAATALDRLEDVAPHLASGTYTKLLRGDVARARHQIDDARRLYESVLTVQRTWEVLARVAYLEREAGRYRKADRLYAEAQETLTVKEMRRWAWLEVQRGMVDSDRDRVGDAEEHFRRAERGYSGSLPPERRSDAEHQSLRSSRHGN